MGKRIRQLVSLAGDCGCAIVYGALVSAFGERVALIGAILFIAISLLRFRMLGRQPDRLWFVVCAATMLAGLYFSISAIALRSFEAKSLNPGFRSAANPGDEGLKYEHISIPSGTRQLDAYAVRAEVACPKTAAVLLFHGRGETIADWIRVQRLLHDHCISSVAFDYSGHGRSSAPGTVAHLNSDALAADAAFASLFPAERRCLLSHSLGGGPMLYAATHAATPVNCIIIASPFSSLRAMAVLGGLPKALRFILPDVWDNVEATSHLNTLMMWLHSKSDLTIPIAFGQAVYDAKKGEKAAVVVDGFTHNAIYELMPPQIWGPITEFILDGDAPGQDSVP